MLFRGGRTKRYCFIVVGGWNDCCTDVAHMDEKQKIAEADGLKRLAFFGISVSTIATLTAIIAVPMLYNYMQHVQSSLQNEVFISPTFSKLISNDFRSNSVVTGPTAFGMSSTGSKPSKVSRAASSAVSSDLVFMELKPTLKAVELLPVGVAVTAEAVAHAESEQLDLRDHQETTESQETTELQETPELLEATPKLRPLPPPPTFASTVHLDQPDLLATQDRLAHQETPDRLEKLHLAAVQDQLVHLGHQDHQETTDNQEPQETQERQERSLKFQELQDQQDRQDQMDPQALLETQELQDLLSLDHQDRQETLDQTEHLEILVHLDLLERLEPLDPEAAATTAHRLARLLDIKRHRAGVDAFVHKFTIASNKTFRFLPFTPRIEMF
ncbi:unnamed protein product [Caenorhabditis auriculariae]|uniref:Nematode cuticle collagen N-terminal domain-containing protein n=1 Tax=Caenorhabditis auriculariae TaxID=2777116 RepID=A0A8S1HU76_9PELO|nr:unnamed protein product [Caenorhabditis auriculariae]